MVMRVRCFLVILLSACLAGCATPYLPGDMGGEDAAETQYSLGVSYLLGQGVRQNDHAAFSAFQRAASAGNPYAQAQLAFLYAAGRGVSRNPAMAFHWYELAASHGLASAQYNLGLLYLHGIGTPRNPDRARELFRDAAEHGFEPARRMIES